VLTTASRSTMGTTTPGIRDSKAPRRDIRVSASAFSEFLTAVKQTP
jgi:hypothetical protein